MSHRRAKTSGWAAFDQQQKQKGVLDSQVNNEPFPSLPGSTGLFDVSERNTGHKQFPVKPFSSVVVPSVGLIASNLDSKRNMRSEVNSSGGSQSRQISGESGCTTVFRQLKELYSWADDSLIEDIMVAAGNDFSLASSFLKVMISDDSLEDHKVVKTMETVSNGRALHEKNDISTQTSHEPEEASSKGCVDGDNENGRIAFEEQSEKLPDDNIEIGAMLGQQRCVPIEPEWEEDDVYLSCRKDAIKMMRAATRHSKAATNYFLRGDHSSAQQFSLKAQEEWEAANKLNAKAGREILKIRNENNGIWRLDLHGLHAAEAIQALQEHLHMIETQLLSKGSNSSGLPNGHRIGAEPVRSSEEAFGRQNKIWLEVITGIGNHSRGGSALPIAVRTFLADTRYRIDEARPGVIMVRPKFHHS